MLYFNDINDWKEQQAELWIIFEVRAYYLDSVF